MRWVVLLGILIQFSFLSQTFSQELRNAAKDRAELGLDKFDDVRLEDIKVAVIDNGFKGYVKNNGVLPDEPRTTYEKKYSKELISSDPNLGDVDYHPDEEDTTHGFRMAHIVKEMTRGRCKLILLPGKGPYNFRRAVRTAIQKQVDIILYSQNWESQGNFDGTGYLDAYVDEATRSGIIWINAAGNYGERKVYNGPVDILSPLNNQEKGGYLQFHLKDEKGTEFVQNFLRLKSNTNRNPAKIILSWNRWEQTEKGTDTDLDLLVKGENGKLIPLQESNPAIGRSVQVVKQTDALNFDQNESNQPMEFINTRYDKNSAEGSYKIYVRAKGNNFANRDRIRITLVPGSSATVTDDKRGEVDSIELLDWTRGESTMVPAGNRNVIAVSVPASYASVGPTADGRNKPDVVLNKSFADFQDAGEPGVPDGTSIAAAYFAGIVAVLKAHWPDLTHAALMRWIRRQNEIFPMPYNPNMFVEQIAPELFQRTFPKIYETVRDFTRSAPLFHGRYLEGGRFLLKTQDPPRDFPGSPFAEQPRGHDFFLLETLARNPRTNGFEKGVEFTTRPQAPDRNGVPSRWPWEITGVDRRRYVDVMQMTPAPSQVLRLWRTPTPQEPLL